MITQSQTTVHTSMLLVKAAFSNSTDFSNYDAYSNNIADLKQCSVQFLYTIDCALS